MLIFFIVSLLASAVGAICGIGGGVVIKPVLDMLHLETVSTISFLSGCTVLSMSCYSVGRSMLAGERRVSFKTGTPLALGSVVGGILGKELFSLVQALFENQNTVGSVQAVCLAIVTAGTLIYTLKKEGIKTHQIKNWGLCLLIGLILGAMSSFLGIGGGPINLVVLYFFFSMDTKTAAANSLYIILFSQLSSLISTLVTGSVPDFRWPVLLVMVAGGIGGGMLGRSFNRKMDNRAVEKLFICLMGLIILISIYNGWRYAQL